MILNANGRKIDMPKTKTAKAVIFVSEDGDTWQPVKPYNVPDWLKDPAAMGHMMAGELLEDLNAQKIYKAEIADV